MFTVKGKYKADINGDLTLEEQFCLVDHDAIYGTTTTDKRFTESLKYDITRTVLNILENARISYGDRITPLTSSLQKNLANIYFKMHQYGYTFLLIDEHGAITGTDQKQGNVKLEDGAWKITKYTQEAASKAALDMYGVVTNAMYSVIDERGILGMFSPDRGTEVKPTQAEKLATSMRNLFGIKKGQRKFGFSDVPMKYSGISLPIKELELPENKKIATATVARIYGIQEDWILSGSTYDNKENAIIQTYVDYKGWILGLLNQINMQRISLSVNVDNYKVEFPGVPQLQKAKVEAATAITDIKE